MADRFKIGIHCDIRYQPSQLLISGIMRFVATHDDLDVRIEANHPSLRSFHYNMKDADGIISGLIGLKKPALKSTKAAIFVNIPAPRGFDKPHAVIQCDNKLIGATAANFFANKKLASVAFIGSPRRESWSIDRGRGFLAAQGPDRPVFSTPSSMTLGRSSVATSKSLSHWLTRLPKPCGIFAAFDQLAKLTMDVCTEIGLAVPEQVSILGVDNESYICDYTRPTLSSVALDFEGAGYQAVQTLIRLLRHEIPSGQVIPLRILDIVERMSTFDTHGSSRLVALAREFIRQHASTDIGPDDIAKSAGCSLRLLELYFKKATGRTLVGELQEKRLERVMNLLRTTNTPIARIGTLCGFSNDLYLKNLFKRKFGTSMREWRGREQSLAPNRAGQNP